MGQGQKLWGWSGDGYGVCGDDRGLWGLLSVSLHTSTFNTWRIV